MNRRRVFVKVAVLVVMITAVGLVLSHRASAQVATGSPFKVGRTYHVEYLGTDADIKVLAAPDANGYVAATVVRGFDAPSRAGTVWVNVRMAVLAREVTAP